MKSRLWIPVAVALAFVSCRTAYHVVTAPVRLIHHPRPQVAASDVETPGRPVAPTPSPSPSPRRPTVTERSTATTSASRSPTPARRQADEVAAKPKAPAASVTQFPTAKPVPDKPGYVYSPSDPTKYVDVSGYAPGSKVKDPYSGKIFLVP